MTVVSVPNTNLIIKSQLKNKQTKKLLHWPRHIMFEEDGVRGWGVGGGMKFNESERQKLEGQNYCQWVKHAKL